MTLPDMKARAQLDASDFRKGVKEILTDLRALQDLGKKVGTLKITADLSAAKDAQRVTQAVRQSMQDMVPSDMQRRIDGLFDGFSEGATTARQSAAVFEAQAAALRAQVNELNNAIRLTRAEFQNGIGGASPEELARLSSEMGRLKGQMDALKPELKETFGVWSNEALKAEMATRTAVATVEAAHGRISRLGLASQVKLGASAALAEFGPQAGFAANGLVQLAQASEKARLSSVFFEKQLQKNNVQLSEGREQVNLLSGAFNVMPNTVEEVYKVLLRNGYTMAQATETMKLYAGSALAAGKDVGNAWEALAQDVMMGTTVMSNALGISANQATSWQQYAKAIGTTTDQLTQAQKAEGFLIQLRKEASQELQDAETILKGYAGSQGQLNQQLRESQLELGQNLMPLLANGTRLLLGFAEGFNALPEPARNLAMVLGVSAVALGVLAGPVSSLVNLYGALTVSTKAAAAAETLATAATTRFNVVTTAKKVLLMDVGAAYAVANTWAMRHNGSMAASVAVNSSVTASLVTLKGAITGVAGAISVYTVAATAALALGLYWADSVKKTTAIYEEADAASQKSFDAMMARVKQLKDSGTELGRAQAKYLLTFQQLQDAQQGELKGVNMITGERIYGKPDEARIQKLQADLAKARENVTLLYTEAQQRGVVNLKLTEDQTKAVQELNKALEGRKFDLKLAGMSDMQRDLARLGQEFDQLRQEFKKPFTVNGQLMDVNQTPALRDGLAKLDAQLMAEQQATRKRYADEAVKTAREAALSAQAAEISAMRDGSAKRRAERDAEVAEIQRQTEEKKKALADFPTQQREVEEAARRTIAAKRQQWAQEDVQLARDHAQRVQRAEDSAAAARISAMKEGVAKQEAQRKLALDSLKKSIAEEVAALEGDPAAQSRVQSAGNDQVAALEQQHARERVEAERAAQEQVAELRRSARAAEIAAIADETQRRKASREEEISDIQRQTAEKVRALADYPRLSAQAEEEGRRIIAAKRQGWAQEDQRLAEETARKVAQAWAGVAAAQFAAQQAGRGTGAAQFEVELARRLSAARENAVQLAQIEADGERERLRRVAESAQAEYLERERVLRENATRTLADSRLSADERRAIEANLTADLAKLDADYQTGVQERLRTSEEQARRSAEVIRAAYLAQSNKPIEQSENRQGLLALDLQLARTDEEVLRLNQEISRERNTQIEALQGQLIGLGGVVLSTEQRAQVEQKIKQLQTEQAQSLRDIEEAQRNIRLSALDRLDAEAQYAEKVSQTADQLAQARRLQLATTQARVRELDSQIAAEGKEAERNRLIAQRFGLLGQIADLTEKISGAPLEDERRKLELYRAQAETRLAAAGLADDEAAKSRLTLEIAAQELLIANQRVQAAQTLAEVQAAQQDQAQAQLAFVQAYTALQKAQTDKGTQDKNSEQEALKRTLDLQNQLFDVEEARRRALSSLNGVGGDTVAGLEAELSLLREKVELTRQQAATAGLSADAQADYLRKQLDLEVQANDAARRLTEARRAAAELTRALARAEGDLNLALKGGAADEQAQAMRRLVVAREALTEAERNYQRVMKEGDPARHKEATEQLTAAIVAQREAVVGLAAAYRDQIASMDGVRDAAQQLKEVAYEGTETTPGTFNGSKELSRLEAIQKRRDQAQQNLIAALNEGNSEEIAKATRELAKEQKRYNDQAKFLDKNGYKNAYSKRGDDLTRKLADQVDALGIQYDRDTLLLNNKAKLAERESQAAIALRSAAELFKSGADTLKANPVFGEDDIQRLSSSLSAALTRAKADTDLRALPASVKLDTSSLDALARTLAPALTPPQMQQAVQQGMREALGGALPTGTIASPLTSVTQPASTQTITQTFRFGDIIFPTQQAVPNPRELAQQVRREIQDDLRRAGVRCK